MTTEPSRRSTRTVGDRAFPLAHGAVGQGVTRGIPYIYEEFRDDLDFTVERMVDQVDPPRFYPLVGPAQLHHCHYKCIVYYTETLESGYPFPFKSTRRRADTVYIDRDHLHL